LSRGVGIIERSKFRLCLNVIFMNKIGNDQDKEEEEEEEEEITED